MTTDYSWIADKLSAHKKTIFLANRKGYGNSKITIAKLSAKRIQIFWLPFSVIIFDLLYLQLDWPSIAGWAYASIFVVAVRFQN